MVGFKFKKHPSNRMDAKKLAIRKESHKRAYNLECNNGEVQDDYILPSHFTQQDTSSLPRRFSLPSFRRKSHTKRTFKSVSHSDAATQTPILEKMKILEDLSEEQRVELGKIWLYLSQLHLKSNKEYNATPSFEQSRSHDNVSHADTADEACLGYYSIHLAAMACNDKTMPNIVTYISKKILDLKHRKKKLEDKLKMHKEKESSLNTEHSERKKELEVELDCKEKGKKKMADELKENCYSPKFEKERAFEEARHVLEMRIIELHFQIENIAITMDDKSQIHKSEEHLIICELNRTEQELAQAEDILKKCTRKMVDPMIT